MQNPSQAMRRIAAATTFAVGAAALAPSVQACGLIDNVDGLNKYGPTLSTNLVQATGDKKASLRAGGFIKEFEDKLSQPTEKDQVVAYPQQATQEMLRVIAVVPPKGMGALDLPVCAQQGGKVVGLWNISARGEVKPITDWKGSTTSADAQTPACKDFIVAARNNFKQVLAKFPQYATNGLCLSPAELAPRTP